MKAKIADWLIGHGVGQFYVYLVHQTGWHGEACLQICGPECRIGCDDP